MESLIGWSMVFGLTGIICWIGWMQWKSYATLDRRIENLDPTLVDSAGTRVEHVLDAPPGSMVRLDVIPAQTVVAPAVPQTVTTTEQPSVRMVQQN